MWVTFNFFKCNRMIKLKIASKRSELHCNNQVHNLKLELLVNTPRLAVLMITVCWDNWNIRPLAGTIHMTSTVICYEITWEKCICVSRTIASTVLPMWQKLMISWSMNVWLLLGCIESDDCNAYFFFFQTFNFVLTVTVYYHMYFSETSKVEAGESITWLPLFAIVWLYNFAVLVTTL